MGQSSEGRWTRGCLCMFMGRGDAEEKMDEAREMTIDAVGLSGSMRSRT